MTRRASLYEAPVRPEVTVHVECPSCKASWGGSTKGCKSRDERSLATYIKMICVCKCGAKGVIKKLQEKKQ